MARGISGTTLRTSLAQVRLLPWSPIYPRRRNCGAGPPKAGCECSTHSVGAISPLKHIEMCSALVMRRKLVQIQPSAPDEPFKL